MTVIDRAAHANRNHALDGLRGWLALVVCLYHGMLIPNPTYAQQVIAPSIWQTPAPSRIAKVVYSILDGDMAVIVFFVMSGAVLFEALNRQMPMRPAPLAVSFAVRRVLRIYPALIFTLLLFWALFEAVQYLLPQVFQVYFSPRELLENISLYRISMYGASWTLQVELFAVPFILIAFALKRRLAVIGLLVFATYALLASASPEMTLRLPNLSVGLFAFSLGFMVPGPIGVRVAEVLGERDWIGLVLLLLCGRMFTPHAAESGVIAQTTAGFLLVCYLFYVRSATANRFLSNRASQFLGRISYSFYLLNPIALELLLRGMASAIRPTPWPMWLGFLLGCLATLLTLPLAAWSVRYVEKPGMDLGKRLTRSLRSTPTVLADPRLEPAS